MVDEFTNVPNLWVVAKLGNVIQLNYGKSLPKTSRDNTGYPVYGSNGVVGSHSYFLVSPPCLVIGRKGSIGETALSENYCWPIDTTYYINEFHGQPIKYWFYQIKALSLDKLNRASAIPGLNREDAYKKVIILPPLNEQRRIVSTIEQLTDRSHKARAALADVPKLIAQFRQSVLAAAFRGDLTADWRKKNPDIEPANLIVKQIETKNTKGKHKNKLEEVEILNESQLSTLPDSWCWGTPSIACSDIVDCPHATAEYIEKGKILIRTSDFRFGYLDISNVKFVSDEIFDKRTKRLQPSALDILYSREGGIFGIACLVPSDLELCMGQRMMLLRANRQCYEPELLMWAMNSPQIFRQASKKVTGTASPHVNVGDIKEFSLPIPPLEEQREILSKINRAFRILHCISEEYLASSKEIEQLDRSILAKAFRGELVPQDPNDEPAAVLLERIRAEREQTSTPKQRGKTTRKNSSKQLSIDLE